MLSIASGSFVYNNVVSSSWVMGDSYSTLGLSPDTWLVLQESLDLGSGRLQISRQANMSIANGKQLTGAVFMVE